MFIATLFDTFVVQTFDNLCYTMDVVHYTEVLKVNTDKIYAEQIANEYAKKEDFKVLALKKLDKTAKMPANIFAYTFGIFFTLLFGVGMCLSMRVFVADNNGLFVAGIIIGIISIVALSINYPIYKKLLESGKKKYACDIIRLAKEIGE